MQSHSFIPSFGLSIANKSDTPWDMQWAFESSMGIQRKIDFIIVSASLEIISGHGSNEINLGSDHRAVKSTLKIQDVVRKRVRFAPTLKNWKPVIGGSGRAENFEAALVVKLDSGNILGVDDVEQVLYEAGTTSGVQVQVQEKCKLWQSDGIQVLI